MPIRLLLLTCCYLSLFACKEKQKSATAKENTVRETPAGVQRLPVDDTTQRHFSVKLYLDDQWQIKKNDPYTLMKTTERGGKKDSVLVPLDSMLWVKMTAPFMAADISDKKYLGWYRVETYEDDVTETNHLNYQAVDPASFTQKMDLAVNPVSSNVRALYIETLEKKGNLTIGRKMQYRPDEILQVITFEKEAGKPGVSSREEYRFQY